MAVWLPTSQEHTWFSKDSRARTQVPSEFSGHLELELPLLQTSPPSRVGPGLG